MGVIGVNRSRRIRAGLCVLAASAGLMALHTAAAKADASWTGATNSNWSVASNWTGTPPASNTAAGTLTFPSLGGCGSCYATRDDLTGVTASGLVFGNTSTQYQINGNQLTVGGGGIMDTPGGGNGVVIHAPLALSGASQTWTVGSNINGYNSFTLLGGITGSAAVTANTPRGDVFIDSDMEVGAVTSNGPGGFHIGGAPGSGSPGTVNATDGQPLTINGGTLIPNPQSATGPLTIGNATLLLGTNTQNDGATTLAVNGSAMLAPSTSTTTFINDNGSQAGTDFSEVSVDGDLRLAGSLTVYQGPNNAGNCKKLTFGDVATLFSATGAITGTFSNAPDGTIITLQQCGSVPAAQIEINYTRNSVTATVVSGATPTTTALAAPNPSPASTNQQVTLTATVTINSNSVSPSGTVAFSADGSVIDGCASQTVTATGSTGTATCTTSFAAAGSPESLTAAFTGASGAGQAPSTSSPQSLTVNAASTATTLSASALAPAAGATVTYSATIGPGIAGATAPSGAIQFLDGGTAIPGCGRSPLTPSGTATCTVTYPDAGSHAITAAYTGDANFLGSSSPPTSVTVHATTTVPPTPSISGSTSRARHIGTQRATLTGTVSPEGASVSWKFEYGSRGRFNHATRPQTVPADHQGSLPVSSIVKGLSPNVRYGYRLVVWSQTPGIASADGKDLMFTTKPSGRLVGPSGQLTVILRTFALAQTCHSKLMCAGRFSLTTMVHRSRNSSATLTCADGRFRIAAHSTETIHPTLSSSCISFATARPNHSLVVTYAAQSRTGQTGLRRPITLVLG